jgi:hypothetical protein
MRIGFWSNEMSSNIQKRWQVSLEEDAVQLDEDNIAKNDDKCHEKRIMVNLTRWYGEGMLVNLTRITYQRRWQVS